jgi:hypothetical protein
LKILLDESTPQKLRLLIDKRHTVATTAFQGWSGLKNGALFGAAEEAGFDLFVTADQELAYQQNLATRRIAVLVLNTNNWEAIKHRVSEINAAIDSIPSSGFAFLEVIPKPQ